MDSEASSLAFIPEKGQGAIWQHQLLLLLDSTGEGIFGIDLDGRCVFINRASVSMLGSDATDVLVQNMRELTHH
jgi:PAS domain-containing protein